MTLADQFEEELDLGPELNRITREVIGAAIEVHRALGPGHLEPVYEKALIIELAERGIPFETQFPVSIYYKDHPVGIGKVDLLWPISSSSKSKRSIRWRRSIQLN